MAVGFFSPLFIPSAFKDLYSTEYTVLLHADVYAYSYTYTQKEVAGRGGHAQIRVV